MDKKRLYHIIEWLIALAACVYLVYRLVLFDDYASLWASLRSMDMEHISALLLCIVLMPVNMALEAWRWKTLMNGDAELNGEAALNDANERLSFSEAKRQVYYSKLAGLITPWRLGEYPARGLLMSKSQISNVQSQMSNSSLWSRVLSMGVVGSATMTAAIVIAGLAGIGRLGLYGLEGLGWTYYLLPVSILLLLLILVLYWSPRLLRRWAAVSHRLIMLSLGQSLARLVCWCVQLALVLWALGAFHLSPFTFHLLPVYYLLVTITPNVPIAEAGVRGAWAIALFGSVNAAFAGVLLWGINTLLPCLVWFFLRKNVKRLDR